MRSITITAFIFLGPMALIPMVLTPMAAAQEPGTQGMTRDLAAIEQLHKRDAAAAKTGDVDTLVTLWTADAVALPPGEQPIIGIDAIRGWLNKNRMDTNRFEITEYIMDFKEVRVAGDQAFEWGRTSIAIRPKGAAGGMHASGNLMRILRRQSDGSWKVARSIWNLEPPSPEKVPPRNPDHL